MNKGDRAAGLSPKKKFLFASVTVLLLLILFEAVLTLTGVGFGWEVEAPLAHEQLRAHVGKSPLWDDEELLEANFSIYADDRLLLWRLRSDLDVRIRNFLLPRDLRGERTFHLKTNGCGFRGPLPPESAPGIGLVLCLGGSNTFGWGLGEGEAFPERLKELLAGEYDVANFGAPGYSSRTGVALWESQGKALEPRWVVIGYGFNDGVQAPLGDDEAMARRGGMIGRTRHVLGRARTYRLVRHVLLSLRDRKAPDPGALGPRVSQASYRRNLERLVSEVRSGGGKPVFLAIQCKYPKTLRALSEELDVVLVDADAIAETARTELEEGGGDRAWRDSVLETFPETVLAKDGRWWVRVDVAHYNRFVHEEVAKALAEIILGKGGGG